ncbi:MAG TPA: Fic family protein [Parafilimonas sp.]|nr:Fic family protein [Parafilimonas sp.]
MQNLMDQIDSLAKELRQLSPLKQEDQARLDKKFRLEFNYNSNHIEGNTLTYGETELLLIFGDTKGNHTFREYEEMKGHDVALKLIEELATDNERPLTEAFIKNLNKAILVEPFWKEAITPDGQPTRRLIKVGDYKELPNSVRLSTGEIFEYASVADTPVLMQELIDWYRSEEKALHPVTLAAMLHYKFVRIHPFDDGNGRIARLLMNYILLKNDLPPVIIKSADKKNYLAVLRLADVGDYEPLISYISEQLIWSLELSMKAAKGESLEETDDFIKEIELIKRKVTETSNPSKSPKLLYNIFEYCNKKIWPSIEKTSEYFNGLFSENKIFHYVNHWDEKFETVNIFRNPLERSTESSIKIFGHDIYKEDVNNIGWKQIKYGLRGAKEATNYTIRLDLNFNHNSYIVELRVGTVGTWNNKIFAVTKHYNDMFLSDEIDQLNNLLKKFLVEEIKKETNAHS